MFSQKQTFFASSASQGANHAQQYIPEPILNRITSMYEYQHVYAQRTFNVPKGEILFIMSFDEVFTEIENKDLQEMLIRNINNRLIECYRDGTPFYIYFDDKVLQRHLHEIDEILGPDSPLVQAIQHQLDVYEVGPEYDSMQDFFFEQYEKGFKTVEFGGVYGSACVWNRACTLAKSIFATIIPNNEHPNFRAPAYIDRDAEYFLFDNAVINPDLTEGCHVDFNERARLGTWFYFPEVVNVATLLGEDFEKVGESSHNFLVYLCYQNNEALLEGADDEAVCEVLINNELVDGPCAQQIVHRVHPVKKFAADNNNFMRIYRDGAYQYLPLNNDNDPYLESDEAILMAQHLRP